MRDDSAEILFQSFLREVIVSGSAMGRNVPPSILSFQHVLCRSRRQPTLPDALKDGFGWQCVSVCMYLCVMCLCI